MEMYRLHADKLYISIIQEREEFLQNTKRLFDKTCLLRKTCISDSVCKHFGDDKALWNQSQQ